jgi:hypothetical protein
LKGTTDIAILTKGYSGCMGQERVGCRVVIELKKIENIDAKARFQSPDTGRTNYCKIKGVDLMT